MSQPEAHSLTSDRLRRQSWYGAKRFVKAFLGLRLPHAAMRAAVALRPGLNARGRLPAPRYMHEVQGRAGEASFKMLRPGACIIAKELYWGHGVRPVASDQYALIAFVALGRDVDVVIDVGAYTGLFTLASATAHPAIQCHAFELVPDVFRLLFDNCVHNDILDRATLHPVAIGNAATCVIPVGSAGSALPDFYSTRLNFNQGVRVRVAPLDEMLSQLLDGKRLLVKIDVEGSEAEVLASGRKLLARYTPDILCEVLPGPTPAVDVESILGSSYNFYLVRGDDLLESDRIRSPKGFRDWLFSAKSASELDELGISVQRSR